MQLAEVHRSSHASWIVGAVALACLAAARPTIAPGVEPSMQVAVTEDGFAVLSSEQDSRSVASVDRDGKQLDHGRVPVTTAAMRMVGTNRGISVAWIDKGKVQLARWKGDQSLGKTTEWGKRVDSLCDGVATGDHTWGIGWLEKDGRVWVVHGSVRGGRTISGEVTDDGEVTDFADEVSATRNTWCAVTSTGRGIALMWRDGAKRYWLNTCDSKGCSDKVLRMPVTPKLALDAIACNKAACLIAAHDSAGPRALWWKLDGKTAWDKPLADAAPETSFSITAAGDAAFALAYVTREGAQASRVIASGSMERAWADPSSQATPALAWSRDVLLVAARSASGVSPITVPLPR